MNIIHSINPSNNEVIDSFPIMDDAQVEQKIIEADICYNNWRKREFSERSRLMIRAGQILIERKEKYAKCMSLEMGKTFQSALAEIEKCAWVCRYYAENATAFLADEIVATNASKSKISYRPLGVLLAVMPWNYPFWQVFRFAAPILMAGNTAVLKHASNVCRSALYVQEVFEDAGFPAHAFNSLIIKSSQVQKIIENPLIKAVSLTGSELAGAAVAGQAGVQIKKTVLELGGNDAYIILEDANLELAVTACADSRLLNAGQSCIGAKRFIIVDELYDKFLSMFKKLMQEKVMGDPFDEQTDYGPLAREDLRREVHNQVLESIQAGATLELGGKIPHGPGFYYPATILTNVSKGMPAYEQEIFGPVASIIRVKDENEAIAIANDSKFGLGACVFTTDQERGERIATYELEAGCCFVNAYVKSDPRLPFGGIKSSGYGRELSHHGIREFVHAKTVYIA